MERFQRKSSLVRTHNRTILELKSESQKAAWLKGIAHNRTILELKSVLVLFDRRLIGLIIVPFWN